MAEETKAMIVSICKHCGQIIEIAADHAASDGFWEPPKIGGGI